MLYLACSVLIFFFTFTFALADVPSGQELGFDNFLNLVGNIANYLYSIAMVLTVIVLIWSGIVFVISGPDPGRAKKAKDILRNGIIGIAIVFGLGTILGTIRVVGTGGLRSLFSDQGGVMVCQGGDRVGQICSVGAECPGSFCAANAVSPQSDSDLPAYGCNSQGQCIQMAGGIFPDSDCSSYCAPAPSAQSDDACYLCVDPDLDGTGNGAAWCLADSQCHVSELDCGGVFTKVPGGCP